MKQIERPLSHADAPPSGGVAVLRPRPLVTLQVLVLLASVLAAYGPALNAGYIWDDDRYLTNNPTLTQPDALRRIWVTAETQDYYPVLYTALWMQRMVWGVDDATPFHAANLAFHVGAVLLLWGGLRELGLPGSYLCAWLFAVHPLNVESVAWISQQKNTLALLFFFACVWSYLRYAAGGHKEYYGGALVCFALSLLAKPMAAAWPVVVVAHGLWRDGRPRWAHVRSALAFGVIAAAVAAVTVHFQYARSLGGVPVGPTTWPDRLAHAVGAWFFYLHKTVLPTGLTAIHAPDAVHVLQPAYVGLLVALVAGGVALARVDPRRLRHAGLALVWFTAMLLPVLGFLKIGFFLYAPAAEHWAYAAIPAVLAPVAAAAHAGLRVSRRGVRLAMVALVGALVIGSTAHARIDSRKYASEETLFCDAVKKNANAWIAYVKLGDCAFERRALDVATLCYETALELNPNSWDACNGLGIADIMRGEHEHAIQHFQACLRLRPSHAGARRNLEISRRALERSATAAGPSSAPRDF